MAKSSKSATATQLKPVLSSTKWKQIDRKVEAAVDQICEMDEKVAGSLIWLIDQMTNVDYDREYKSGVAFNALRSAFKHTNEFHNAQQAFLDRLLNSEKQTRKGA